MPEPCPFDWNKFYAGLLSHDLKPSEISEMTLPECLLYSLSTEDKSSGVSIKNAIDKITVLKSLGIEDRIALARLRAGY